eukprot:jgi/Psemu1/214567/e_gw1.697.15.1
MATNDKYDRQLRLWGAQGQRALGDTRVVSVGTSAAGTETLKNLVLPGVGAFTVMDFVDDEKADADADAEAPDPEHSGNGNGSTNANAVFEEESMRTTEETITTPDANPDANAMDSGEVDTDAATATATEANQQLTPKKRLLVVAADVVPPILEALADACWKSGHPLLVVTSYGLIGSVRLQLPKNGVVLLQPKPTNSPPDLRLVTSFPAFREFVDSVVGGSGSGSGSGDASGEKLDRMDNQQHGHVPYPVFLAKAMDTYHNSKSESQQQSTIGNGNGNGNGNGKRILPKTFTEKQDFVNNYVKPMARDLDTQLNFQEAVSNAYLAYTERDLDWMNPELHPLTTNLSPNSKLGQLKRALETFLREHPDQRPPLNGSVPDMTASTDLYVRLQQLYRTQAEEDLRRMTEIVRSQQQQQQQQQQANNSGSDDLEPEPVTDEDIANFCANVYSVGHAKTRSLLEEYRNDTPSASDGSGVDVQELMDDWKMALIDHYEVPVHTPFLWYLGVRAAQTFCHRTGRYPGCHQQRVLEEDAALLSEIFKDTVTPQYGISGKLTKQHIDAICKELTRYGNAEIHTVASVIGGVASQEAVKIVTGQYVPLDNTYVYNGIVSVGGVYRF